MPESAHEPKRVSPLVRAATWLFLTLGVVLVCVGNIAQWAFVATNKRMPSYAQDVLRWSESRYATWTHTVGIWMQRELWNSGAYLVLLCVFLGFGLFGMLWRLIERKVDAKGWQRRSVYVLAASLACLVSLAVFNSEVSSVGGIGWALLNTLPHFVAVILALLVPNAIAAACLSALFNCAIFLAHETWALYRKKAASIGTLASATGLPATSRDAVLALLDKAGYPADRVYLINANVVFTMAGLCTSSILVGWPNMHKRSIESTLALVAHEIGHWKRGHLVFRLAERTAMAGVRGVVPFALASPWASWVLAAFGASAVSHPFGLGLLVAPVVADALIALARPLSLWIRRVQELRADESVYELGSADGLARLFRDDVYYASDMIMHPLYEVFNEPHAEGVERVRRTDAHVTK